MSPTRKNIYWRDKGGLLVNIVTTSTNTNTSPWTTSFQSQEAVVEAG